MCQGSLKKSFKEVSRVFKERFKCILKKSVKGVSRKIERCIKGVLSAFQGFLKEVESEF